MVVSAYSKKILVVIVVITMFICVSVGCSSTEEVKGAGINEVSPASEVTGYVISSYGNEITLQLVDIANSMPSQMGEGMTEKQSMTENMQGNRGDMSSGDRAQMGQGMAEGRDPSMIEERMPSMSGKENMPGAREGGSVDLSNLYTLSDEVVTYLVPVNTPVLQYGSEFSFSQIAAEMYITLSMDESGQIISIEIIGA